MRTQQLRTCARFATGAGPLEGSPCSAAGPTPSAPAATNSSNELSAGFGVNWGPTISERDEQRYFELGPSLMLALEIPGDKVSFRLTPTLNFGFVGPNQWRKFGELELAGELRFHLTPDWSAGVGAFAGGGLSNSPGSGSSALGGYGTFGAFVTPVALRFGEARREELLLSVALVIDAASGHSGVDCIRPTLAWMHHF